LPHFLKQGVFFKPGPQHGEIVDLDIFSDVKTFAPLQQRRAFDIVNDLAFPAAGLAINKRMSKVFLLVMCTLQIALIIAIMRIMLK
jgi:hypothetical protein